LPRFALSILTVIGQMSAGVRNEAGEQLSKFEKRGFESGEDWKSKS
jgi:hypothetical protein